MDSSQGVSKDDYVTWKHDKVTQAFMGEVKKKLLQEGFYIANGAAPDYADYKYHAGMYAAFMAVLEIDYEETDGS